MRLDYGTHENVRFHIFRKNFGDPNFVKIEFHKANTNHYEELLDYSTYNTGYNRYNRKQSDELSFEISGKNQNYNSLNCTETEPCEILIYREIL